MVQESYNFVSFSSSRHPSMTLAEATEALPVQNIHWPNFYCVGAPKAGTTFVFEHLRGHPQVFLPRSKEPEFFSTYPATSAEEYRRLYAGAGGFAAIADFSPFYLSDPGAHQRIHEASPSAKILILLRDPVARAHSHFLMYRRTGVEPEESFLKALRRYFESEGRGDEYCRDWKSSREYVESGMYYGQVRRYVETFGARQVKVLLLDDLTREPRETMLQVAQFLGIDPAPFEKTELSGGEGSFRAPRYQGLYRMVRDSEMKKRIMLYLPARLQLWLRESPLLYGHAKPSIDPEARRYLQEIYGPDVDQLEEFLGRKFPELRKSWA